ncbi:hypothetical protein PDIDSM_5587 [Penicillium digitatum]|nr:hypothetical protein PDIDSM_5587 [Penicillium digitatum]
MARESNAPLVPLTPGGEPNAQSGPAHVQEPIKPSFQHSKAQSISCRTSSTRPSTAPQQPQSRLHGQASATPHAYRPPGTSGAAVATPSVKRSEPWDPFKPVAPSAYNNTRGGIPHGAVSIKRPENVTWTTPRAPRPIYQSKPVPPKMGGGLKNLQKFIDLTRDDTDPVPRASAYASPSFGAMDMNGYVDTAMANENIKALLEGAFEDEEDKAEAKIRHEEEGWKESRQ